jgi:hypothetical protein
MGACVSESILLYPVFSGMVLAGENGEGARFVQNSDGLVMLHRVRMACLAATRLKAPVKSRPSDSIASILLTAL